MQRKRVVVLVGLGVAAVLAFLLAPTEGRFARVPFMVLCAVLALIWHLVAEGADAVLPGAAVPAGPTAVPLDGAPRIPDPMGVAAPGDLDDPAHHPGYFELELEVEQEPASVRSEVAASQRDDISVDLADLPDPPSNWPPTVVDVPLVFQLDGSAPTSEPVPEAAEDHEPLQVIDLTGTDTAGPGSLGLDLSDLDLSDLDLSDLGLPDGGLPDGAEVPLGHEVASDAHAMADEDPWLAFAATMFGPGAR